jgi:hypothetical protein
LVRPAVVKNNYERVQNAIRKTGDRRIGRWRARPRRRLLSPALHRAEERLGREVNVTAYSPEEFREKIKSLDHFLAAVLRERKRFLKGGQSDLDEIVGE